MKHERHDRQAAKTTIVGGQPPGNARELPPIPAGIEEILGMAAAEPRYADVLFGDRERAVAASGVELSPTERTILGAVPEPTLRQMVERLALTEQDRRYFIARSAAVLLVLVGGATAAAGCQRTTVEPEPPPPPAPHPDPAPPRPPAPRPSELEVETGVRPGRPPEPMPPTGTGIRPDRPDLELTTTGVRPDRPPAPIGTRTGIRPDRPEPDPTAKGGARPDRPDAGAPKPKPRPRPRPTRGIRPDYPRTKGIRPDRPGQLLNNPFDDGEGETGEE